MREYLIDRLEDISSFNKQVDKNFDRIDLRRSSNAQTW